MNKIVSFIIPQDLCSSCNNRGCRKTLHDKASCYLELNPYVLVENKEPETWQELVDMLYNSLLKKGLIFFQETNNLKDEFWFNGVGYSKDGNLYFKHKGDIVVFMRKVSYPLMWKMLSKDL